jgi:hypothetical protein
MGEGRRKIEGEDQSRQRPEGTVKIRRRGEMGGNEGSRGGEKGGIASMQNGCRVDVKIRLVELDVPKVRCRTCV